MPVCNNCLERAVITDSWYSGEKLEGQYCSTHCLLNDVWRRKTGKSYDEWMKGF